MPSSSEVTYVKVLGIVNARRKTGNAQEGKRNQQSWLGNGKATLSRGEEVVRMCRSQTRFTPALEATVGVSA